MRRLLSALVIGAVAAGGVVVVSAGSSDAETVTPGSFTGYGFDTCNAPTQKAMDAWRVASPFRAVGIYVSGSERACEAQPNLTRQWVQTQAARGWRFIPIHVGLQAPCRGSNSKGKMSSDVATARSQGIAEANEAVKASGALGIARNSYLYLDIEQYPIANTTCNEAVLSFMEGWTDRIEARGYGSGVYSSASAAIRALDVVRTDPSRSSYNLPGHLWLAWSNGRADTDGGQYLRDDGWSNHQRIHQYVLDRTTTYNKTKIHIDYNFMDVGKGSRATKAKGLCNAQKISTFTAQKKGRSNFKVKVAKCLLKKQGFGPGVVNERFTAKTRNAVIRLQRARGLKQTGKITRGTWTALVARGTTPVLKHGHTGKSVHRVQTALRAAGYGAPASGIWDAATTRAMKAYRKSVDLPQWPTAEPQVWAKLQRGRR
ncbi:glycoside hydrolase domain-containing protein [Solicola sp. PLA-1-18]|uniref:glycoside hydrolase domain-containing protein n=1 Tax=Solicola sp. PLA-1-18 TaxID=3380532 RepID=UPI003B7764F0